jgi:formylglycine-generating enzyme required for sulfatase activity
MMKQAGRLHGLRSLVLAATALVLAALGQSVRNRVVDANRETAAHGLVQQIVSAETAKVPDIIRAIKNSDRRWADPELRQITAEAPQDSKERLHASLALLPVEPGQAEYLYRRLLNANPNDLPVIRQALDAHQPALVERLWAVLENAEASPHQRFCAACALAGYVPGGSDVRWRSVSGFITERLLASVINNPSDYAPLLETLRPIRERLLPSLSATFRDEQRPDTERSFATSILADYAGDQPAVLADLLMDSGVKAYPAFFPIAQRREAETRPLFQAEIARKAEPEWNEAAKDQLAERQARAAVALVRLGRADEVWPLLRHSTDPRLRSFIVNWLRPLGADPHAIVAELDRLDSSPPPAMRGEGGRRPGEGLETARRGSPTVGRGSPNVRRESPDPTVGRGSPNVGRGSPDPAQDNGRGSPDPAHEPDRRSPSFEPGTDSGRPSVAPVARSGGLATTKDPPPRPAMRGEGGRRPGEGSSLPPTTQDPPSTAPTMDMILFHPETSVRRALILALGAYDPGSLSPGEREPLIGKLVELYKTDPDAGIHGAAEWTLRQWKQEPALKAADTELTQLKTWADRRWYLNSQGQTFAVIDGPVEFRMGSPPAEPDRVADNEPPHRRIIPRRFAIAAKEVTVEQYEQFVTENPGVDHAVNDRYSPDPKGATNVVSWYDAVAYCNWLSRKEGLSECYEPKAPDQYAEGMTIRADALERTGYRLPTEAEWEYACRSGTGTSRYFGASVELLGKYAWYQATSHDHAWLCGRLLPNDLGLFDMLGNVIEWCQDRAMLHRPDRTGPTYDNIKLNEYLNADPRLLRGGGFGYPPAGIRSAYRLGIAPSSRNSGGGFRLARTYR